MIKQHLHDGTANPEWLAQRIGKFTGSRFGDLMRTTGGRPAIPARPAVETVRDADGNVITRASKATAEKPALPGKPTAARANLIATIVIERMTGKPIEVFENFAMRRGSELEPLSIETYENLKMVAVQDVGFVDSPLYDFIGVSPDGYVGEDGMIETKSPMSESKHLGALLDATHADEYVWQIQGQMWICERAWVDMVSFDPRWPKPYDMKIVRVARDESLIADLEEACIKANDEVEMIIARLTAS